jgi:hypothetical protein
LNGDLNYEFKKRKRNKKKGKQTWSGLNLARRPTNLRARPSFTFHHQALPCGPRGSAPVRAHARLVSRRHADPRCHRVSHLRVARVTQFCGANRVDSQLLRDSVFLASRPSPCMAHAIRKLRDSVEVRLDLGIRSMGLPALSLRRNHTPT